MPHRSNPLPNHLQGLTRNIAEVDKLVDLHEEVSGTTPGRRSGVGVLNKSGIVLVVSCWEAYVEDLALVAFERLIRRTHNPKAFPAKVRSLASQSLREDKNPVKVWELAGDGWRKVLRKHKTRVLGEMIGGFNTPRAHNVDRLFEELIGIKRLSSTWHWRGMGNREIIAQLNALVTKRGAIAHRVTDGSYVKKNEVKHATKLIENLAVVSSNRVAEYLRRHLKKKPWHHVSMVAFDR